MNALMLAVSSTGGRIAGPGPLGDSFAVFLFMSGAVSLAIAGYLLYKAPRPQPVRVLRRR